MNALAVIAGMALVTYLARLAGFSLTGARIPPFWLRFLRFVPVSVFAALVVPALPGEQGEWAARMLAAAASGMATWRTRQLWVGLLVGMGVFLLLRRVWY